MEESKKQKMKEIIESYGLDNRMDINELLNDLIAVIDKKPEKPK